MREFYLLVIRVFVIIIEGDKIEKENKLYFVDSNSNNKCFRMFKWSGIY